MELEFFVSTILAGIMATWGLQVMAAWAPRLGLPRMDFAAGMAALTYGPSFEDRPSPYFGGQTILYLNGIFFALLYAGVVGQYLPGDLLVRGVIWGAILWVVSGVFYVPVYHREGFFAVNMHKMAWLTSAIAHGAYGLLLGWLAPVMGAGAA